MSDVSGRNADVRARPEPSIDDARLKIGSVTAFEVALAAGRPDVFDISAAKVIGDEVRLLLCLNAHQVLTVLPADIPCIQPVPFMLASGAVRPREEVIVTIVERGSMVDSVSARFWVWSDQLPSTTLVLALTWT